MREHTPKVLPCWRGRANQSGPHRRGGGRAGSQVAPLGFVEQLGCRRRTPNPDDGAQPPALPPRSLRLGVSVCCQATSWGKGPTAVPMETAGSYWASKEKGSWSAEASPAILPHADVAPSPKRKLSLVATPSGPICSWCCRAPRGTCQSSRRAPLGHVVATTPGPQGWRTTWWWRLLTQDLPALSGARSCSRQDTPSHPPTRESILFVTLAQEQSHFFSEAPYPRNPTLTPSSAQRLSQCRCLIWLSPSV